MKVKICNKKKSLPKYVIYFIIIFQDDKKNTQENNDEFKVDIEIYIYN